MKIQKVAQLLAVALMFVFSLGSQVLAQSNLEGEWSAKVLKINSDQKSFQEDLGIEVRVQNLEALIQEGPEKGKTIEVINDYFPLGVGDDFFVIYNENVEGVGSYSMHEPDRRSALVFFVILFVVVVLVFGGKQGVRSLAALAGTFLVIFYLMFPVLLAGYSPLLVCSFFASLIMVFAIYTTHGFNKKSTAALIGTILTIIIAILISYLAVKLSKLTGLTDDMVVYLNFNTGGKLDFSGLLLGSIIIGILGVLDDIAITQAAAVKEIHEAAPSLNSKRIFQKAMAVGREHVGALVNTLILAYASVAMPLLLFIYSDNFRMFSINSEIFAVEIIRTIVGSTAIILAVPISTLIAVSLLIKPKKLGS